MAFPFNFPAMMFARLPFFSGARNSPFHRRTLQQTTPYYIAPSTWNLVINVILLQPPYVTDDPEPHLLYILSGENMPARCRNRDAHTKERESEIGEETQGFFHCRRKREYGRKFFFSVPLSSLASIKEVGFMEQQIRRHREAHTPILLRNEIVPI